MQDAVINFSRVAYNQPAGRAAPRRGDGGGRDSGTSGVFPCKGAGANDYCYIHATRGDNQHWLRLVRAMGQAELADDPRFATSRDRVVNGAELRRIIEDWTRQLDKVQVMDVLGRAGVPVGAVYDTRELLNDPFLREREMFATVQHPVRGDFTMPGWPVRMSRSHVPLCSAPLLGQDNDRVYAEIAGCSPQALQELRDAHVI
jgi:formyl-CoA transferase